MGFLNNTNPVQLSSKPKFQITLCILQRSLIELMYMEMFQEELPYSMPAPNGKEVLITVFADANLNHDYVIGKSVTCLLMMLNKTPVDWFSKRQNCVETATYGSEFMAVRIGTEKIMM